MGRVEGKVAVVTGAAAGIGLASAMLLARHGARVMLTDIAGDAVALQAQVLRNAGGIVASCEQDIAAESTWITVFDETERLLGPVDILVNNAGIAHVCGIETVTSEALRRVMSVNVEGTFWGVREAVRKMRLSKRRGSIVNISSLGGIVGDPQNSIYNASKAAVRLMSKCVALECARRGDGIRVNSVHPGLIATDSAKAVVSAATGRPIEESLVLFKQLIPLGHPGTPEDVAHAVLYLASDEAAYVTGTELVIDGGWSAQ